jgi:hypothetical protein
MELNIQTACEILEINYNDVSSFTMERLKKQYYKLALQNHPDKHNNSLQSTVMFQEINAAYNYLQNLLYPLLGKVEQNRGQHGDKWEQNRGNSGDKWDKGCDNAWDKNVPFTFSSFTSEQMDRNNDNPDSTTYMYLLSIFITTLAKSAYYKTDLFTTILKDIVTGCKQISMKLFDGLSKEMSLEVYSFLLKYQHILYIKEEILIKVKEVLLEKYENTCLVIINPSIDDLFDCNIYKLVHEGVTYFVPLWHSELYYDVVKNDAELIVKCIPDLGTNIMIDEFNNIHVTVHAKLSDIDLKQANACLLLRLGKQTFEIPYDKLLIKSVQYYTLRKKGIAKIDEVDMYYVDDKGDIIVKIIHF